ELVGREAGPLAVDFTASDRTSGEKHTTGVPMVRAARAVLPDGAAELGHCYDYNIAHEISEIEIQGSKTITKILRPIRQLAARAALIRVRIPPADIGEGHLQSNLRFHQLRDLLEGLSKGRVWISNSGGRRVLSGG